MRATYQSRSGMSDEQMNDLFAGDGTYLTAQEAKDLGLLDEVTPAINVSASFDTDRLPDNIKALLTPKAQESVEPAAPVEPEAPLEPTLAEQMQAALERADLMAFADTYTLAFTDMASLQAAISNAREVKALCAILAEDARPFIQARKSIADVRAALLAKRSADPEVDTAPAPKTGGAPITAQPSATTADIWAARRKS
jgi:enoyl-CoA hydratase/carnithine racemase